MRLFVALDLPHEVRNALLRVMDQLKPMCRGARWVRPESIHLTLKFIGHVIADGDMQKLNELRAALAPIHSVEPVRLNFRGLGFFPGSRRPRVIWSAVQASPNLAELASQIDIAVEPFGVPREKREFTPHLTLARIESSKSCEPLVRAAEAFQSNDFGSSTESAFHLFESKLKPSGAEYAKLQTFVFAKGAE